MRAFWPIFKRELFAFFVTPLAWVLILAFLVLQGMHFYLLIDHFSGVDVSTDQTPVQAFFGDTVLLYLILFLLVPPMTMRLFSEERRSGTIETLMTAPVSAFAVVLAKYLSAVVTYIAMWLPTLLYLLILQRTGAVDWKAAGASYLGVLLVGGGYLSIGLLMSSLTKSQFLALVGTALCILMLFIIGLGEFIVHPDTTIYVICNYLSVWAQMSDFANGLIDTRHLVLDGTLIVVPLFMTTRIVDAWRWG